MVKRPDYQFFLRAVLLCFRYYVLLIIGSICLVVALLKFTSRERTSLVSLARRALLPYIVRNHQHERVSTPRVSLDEFVDAEEELGTSGRDRNLREADAYESRE